MKDCQHRDPIKYSDEISGKQTKVKPEIFNRGRSKTEDLTGVLLGH